MTFVKTKLPCPKCNSSDAYCIDNKGWGTCFSCGLKKPPNVNPEYTNMNESKPKYSVATIAEIEEAPTADLSYRGLDNRSAEKFGVKALYNTNTGKQEWTCWPAPGGYKIKPVDKSKKPMVVGKLEGFLNQDNWKKGKWIFVTEGEEDAAATLEIVRGKGLKTEVTSIMNGANLQGTISNGTAKGIEKIKEMYSVVVLCFDQDEPGRKFAESVALKFASYVEVRIAKWEGGKDANDMLRAGLGDKYYHSITNAPVYRPDSVVTYWDVVEKAKQDLPKGFSINFLPDLQRNTGGIIPGQLWTLIAPSGSGKTMMCREIDYTLMHQGCKVGKVFLEEGVERTLQGLWAIHYNIPLYQVQKSPKSVIDFESDKFRALEEKIANNMCFKEHFGNLSIKALTDTLSWMVGVDGCQVIILDHLSMVGIGSSNKVSDLDELMDHLQGWVHSTKAALILVSHINRSEHYVPKKDGKIAYPYWRRVYKESGRGSSAIEQNTHVMIGLEPRMIDPEVNETGRDIVRVQCLKNRLVGYEGICDYYRVDRNTGRIVTVKKEDYE